MIGDDVESQADQALKNLGAILTAAGSSYEKVVKVTVLLADINDFAAINKIYGTVQDVMCCSICLFISPIAVCKDCPEFVCNIHFDVG